MPDIYGNQLAMWEKWKSGDKTKLPQLVKSFEPMVRHQISVYKDAPIPKSVLEAEAKHYLLEALNRYNPSQGAALSTYAYQWMRKLDRFVGKYQNVGRIPERRIAKISTFKDAETTLKDKLGRDPTIPELTDELNWSKKDVIRLRRELRKDLSSDEIATGSVEKFIIDIEKTPAVSMLVDDLDDSDRYVFEHSTGYGGAERMSVEDIAKRTKKDASQVYRMRQQIADKILEYQDAFQ